MEKNFKICIIMLSIALALLLTACDKSQANVNKEIADMENSLDTVTGNSSETMDTILDTITENIFSESKQTSASTEIETLEKTIIPAALTESNSETITIINEEITEITTVESKQTVVTEIETVTKEEISDSIESSTESIVTSLYEIHKKAVPCHKLHQEEDKIIDLTVRTPTFIENEAPGGWYYPIDYNNTTYKCSCFCDFLADEKKDVTILEKFNNQLDNIIINIENFEFLGTIGEANLGAGRFDEADVYKYEDKLILIYNNIMYKKEEFLLHSWEFRKDFFGISDEENSYIGADPEKLHEVLSKLNIDYNPNVFLSALLYEKRD